MNLNFSTKEKCLLRDLINIEEINFKPVIKIKDIYKPDRILEQELKEIRKDK